MKKKTQQYDLFGEPIIENVLLRDKFIEPPFSVLDTKTGSWQNRKRQWQRLGIKSETTREKVVVINNSFDGDKYGRKGMPEVSIFDPALTELMYYWFCPENGKILDPFAGGSVRGIIANYLGYKYTGIELRKEQVESNKEQSIKILPEDNQPKWHTGDSDKILDDITGEYDFIFSCPPYMDLEVYSKLPDDISNMTDENFRIKYKNIIGKTCSKLKRSNFACFVVGDIRNKKTGYYKDFVAITKLAFYGAGMRLYNEAILLNTLGTAMLRANNCMKNKKLVKVHQNVLIFIKP